VAVVVMGGSIYLPHGRMEERARKFFVQLFLPSCIFRLSNVHVRALIGKLLCPRYRYAVGFPLDNNNIDDICRSASESRHTETERHPDISRSACLTSIVSRPTYARLESLSMSNPLRSLQLNPLRQSILESTLPRYISCPVTSLTATSPLHLHSFAELTCSS
jgi:hypothetical protein